MSDRWGAFEDVAKLRERITVIETNLPLLRADNERQFRQLSENQVANRKWTEEQFTELTLLIKTAPVVPKSTNDRLFWAVVSVGVVVAVVGVLVILNWIYGVTGGNLG